MAPLELLVDDVSLPFGCRIVRLGVDHDLMAVPRLDGGNHRLAVFQLPLLDLAGAAVALGIGLVAVAPADRAPFAAVAACEPRETFVAGAQKVAALAALGFDPAEIVQDVQAVVDDLGPPAVARRVLGNLVG